MLFEQIEHPFTGQPHFSLHMSELCELVIDSGLSSGLFEQPLAHQPAEGLVALSELVVKFIDHAFCRDLLAPGHMSEYANLQRMKTLHINIHLYCISCLRYVHDCPTIL